MAEWICLGCGDVAEVAREEDPWDCVICGHEMELKEEYNSTPNEELEDLIERWEEAAKFAKERGLIKEYDGIMGCVDDLREVIND